MGFGDGDHNVVCVAIRGPLNGFGDGSGTVAAQPDLTRQHVTTTGPQ